MQKLPQADYRVDTGPLQIGDDWPGYFIRGKETINLSGLLRYVATKVEAPLAERLRHEADRLAECLI